jgi:hypothetical protein
MLDSISFDKAIVPPGPPIGVLFPELVGEYLLRQLVNTESVYERNHLTYASPQEQTVKREDRLVRLPSLRASKWKVTVLQKWTGTVQRVMPHKFFAILDDTTNPSNPLEEVELDIQEISESDLPLLVVGGAFYWSIGYRDTSGGQRERVSTLRFARQPSFSQADVDRIFEQADHTAALLESD